MRGRGGRRKRPGRHTVHPKDPRYNVSSYPRGEGLLQSHNRVVDDHDVELPKSARKMYRRDLENNKRWLREAQDNKLKFERSIKAQGRSPMMSEQQRLNGFDESIRFHTEEIKRLEEKLGKTKKGRTTSTKPLPSGLHTGGVKELNGDIAKPLVGLQKVLGEEPRKYPTKEYEAIKNLDDLPHIPKEATKKEIDGVPHLIRENLYILKPEDYLNLKREDLASIEKTIREANERGWMLNDTVQLGFSHRQNELVVYDWSAAMKYDPDSNIADDGPLINRMWKEAGYENYVKARTWADGERFKYNVDNPEEGIYYRYAYMSFARPPSKLWMDLPEESAIQQITPDESWKPLGLVYTVDPLSEDRIRDYELQPTRYGRY